MHTYYRKLHLLKGFLVTGESVILFIRLVFQILFSLPSALLVMQVCLTAFIYSRKYCQNEAQIYLIINCILFYSMAYNELFELYYKNAIPNPLNENFKNNYKIWGYIAQSIFRAVGMVIAWRCYQFSKMHDEESDVEQI